MGGAPVNEGPNVHGQGYADLNFMIPEVVDRVRVLEGPYDPRQGDFAVAVGALRPRRRGPRRAPQGLVRDVQRAAPRRRVRAAARRAPRRPSAGEALARSDGYGQNRASSRAAVIAQYARELAGERHRARARDLVRGPVGQRGRRARVGLPPRATGLLRHQRHAPGRLQRAARRGRRGGRPARRRPHRGLALRRAAASCACERTTRATSSTRAAIATSRPTTPSPSASRLRTVTRSVSAASRTRGRWASPRATTSPPRRCTDSAPPTT